MTETLNPKDASTLRGVIPFQLVALDADADGLHPANADPLWREAWYFEFYDPRAHVQWQAYQGVFPNQGTGDLTLAVFYGGRLQQQVLKLDYALPPDPIEERLRFAALNLEMLEPFRLWRLRYDTQDLQADLRFEAIHAPYSWAESRLFMENASDEKQRSQHFDQLGRYTGSIWINGRELEINTLGFRDRMWGWGARRQWQNYVVLWAAFNPNFVVNVSIQQFGQGQQALCGYLHQEGERSLLKNAHVEVEWHPVRWKTVRKMIVTVEDRLGRKVQMEGRPQGITDTSHFWKHRTDNMMFSVGEYQAEGRIGHGVMNWSFLNETTKPCVLEASL